MSSMARPRPAPAATPARGAAVRADPDALARVVDALAHLYDTGRLQTHPLARADQDGRVAGGRALRQELLDAVEALRPERGTPAGAAPGRAYELLKLRYVEGLTAPAVQDRLAIAKSEYYREHRRAVAAVAAILDQGRAAEPARLPPR